jgi:hypothetical protein
MTSSPLASHERLIEAASQASSEPSSPLWDEVWRRSLSRLFVWVSVVDVRTLLQPVDVRMLGPDRRWFANAADHLWQPTNPAKGRTDTTSTDGEYACANLSTLTTQVAAFRSGPIRLTPFSLPEPRSLRMPGIVIITVHATIPATEWLSFGFRRHFNILPKSAFSVASDAVPTACFCRFTSNSSAACPLSRLLSIPFKPNRCPKRDAKASLHFDAVRLSGTVFWSIFAHVTDTWSVAKAA